MVDLEELNLLCIEPLPSCVWYQDMADFAAHVSDERAGAEALDLGRALLGSIETRAKLRHGMPEPPASESINGSSEFGHYVTCHQPR